MKQRFTELNIVYILYPLAGTKQRMYLLEINQISYGLFINRGLRTTPITVLFYSSIVPQDLFSILHQGLIKEEMESASFTDVISIWNTLKSLPLIFFKCCYASLTVGTTTSIVVAVYRPPGLIVHFFIDHFTVFFEEKSL